MKQKAPLEIHIKQTNQPDLIWAKYWVLFCFVFCQVSELGVKSELLTTLKNI